MGEEAVLARIDAVLEEEREAVIKVYKDLVNCESFSREIENVRSAFAYYMEELEKEGFSCDLIEVGANAPTLVATLGKDRPGAPILFGGHIDTVFQKGEFGEDPFRIKGDTAYGPGVFDMKGGLCVALAVAKVLNRLGYDERPIKLLISGDEEINHLGSTSADVMVEASRGALCAFNMEPTEYMDQVVTRRKGNMRYKVTVEGVSAHCCMAFKPGIVSAIHEMAHKIVAWTGITDWSVGTGVNIGTITGGTTTNTVAERCEVQVDIRFSTAEEMERAQREFEAICAKPFLEGAVTRWEFLCKLDVFEPNARDEALFAFLSEAFQACGYGTLRPHYEPGASDMVCFAKAGVPALCGCGNIGDGAHTKQEFASVESIFARAKLLSVAVLHSQELERALSLSNT